ncbi:hypothetical protein [Novipirellula artificiosorum]|uniref:Uncharacterized protein n=1 Tax=Novipirellula artificiosorum TaxID=2528016 RepID=A0A5C6DIM3_9BACT|nr:hypothetical protein [Novipirellula artificiosorum]TWU37223.1 hypothetical protein Poly41_33510 [Novipirellula artificiosorum]
MKIHAPIAVRRCVSRHSERCSKVVFRLALAAAISVAASSPSSLFAADCGCSACDAITAMDECDCGFDAPSLWKPKHNPIYKTLDAFAGGIEKLLRLDQCPPPRGCCDESVCDGACDSAFPGDRMMAMPEPMWAQPMPSGTIYNESTPPAPVLSQPMESAPAYSAPRVTSPAVRSIESSPQPARQTTPRSPMHMTEPRIQSAPLQMVPMERAAPRTAPRVQPGPKREGGSLFDALSDPSSDGAQTWRPSPVRPSGYTAPSRPASSRRTAVR